MAFLKRISDKMLKVLYYYLVTPFYFIWSWIFSSTRVKKKVEKQDDIIIQSEHFMDISIKSEELEELVDLTKEMDDSQSSETTLHRRRKGPRCWTASRAELESGGGETTGIDPIVRRSIKAIVDFLDTQQTNDHPDAAAHRNNSLLVTKSEITVEELEDDVLSGLKMPFVVDSAGRYIVAYKKKDIHET